MAPSEQKTFSAIVAACLLNALVGAGFYYARQIDKSFSIESGILIRVLANFSFFLIPLAARKPLSYFLPARTEGSLWFWALFGALTVWSYFWALSQIGAGATNLLNAGSGVMVVALAPILARQRLARFHLVCAIGCLVGLGVFTIEQASHSITGLGIFAGIASGAFSALAYLMVAKSRDKYSPLRVVFYWSWFNLLIGAILVTFSHLVWPQNLMAWSALIVAGLGAAASQYLTAYAYQRSQASLVACVSYLGPAISLILDALLFDFSFSFAALIGVALTLIFSILAPLEGRLNRKLRKAAPSVGIQSMPKFD